MYIISVYIIQSFILSLTTVALNDLLPGMALYIISPFFQYYLIYLPTIKRIIALVGVGIILDVLNNNTLGYSVLYMSAISFFGVIRRPHLYKRPFPIIFGFFVITASIITLIMDKNRFNPLVYLVTILSYPVCAYAVILHSKLHKKLLSLG